MLQYTKEEEMSSRSWRKHLCPTSVAILQPIETRAAISMLDEHNDYFGDPLVV